ncbi:MAG: FAD-dependent oxidoreductase [bacterium]|nr:FAD-dependent oxidoreductase [bacterium]
MLYDLAIIGGGPAGVAAGVYASRKRLKTVFIARDFGGQSTVSEGIENWIGTIKISGNDLAKALEAHLRAYAGDIVDIKAGETVQKITKNQSPITEGEDGGGFTIQTDTGSYTAKTVLVTAGSARRKLEVKGAEGLEHKGITYCASCDGPLFADLDTVVIGGGNAGFETAAQLLAYTKSVTLIHKSAEFKADPVTVKKVLENPKMKAMLSTDILEVKGDKFVTGLVYQNKDSGGPKELPVQGIFVEIGSTPATDFLGDLVKLTPYKQIIVDPKTQRAYLLPPPETASGARRGESGAGDVGTATASATQRLRNEADEAVSGGVWAAGDCTDGLYHQNNIAAGDAVKALEDIYLYLHTS